MTDGPFEPEMPPPPFVPPFDPPGSEPPYVPEGSSTDDDGSSDDFGPCPPWWPDDFPWPPGPEEPTVIESYPPIHVWPRLPPDHPYHVPPGYLAPDNLPPGHPGEYYPEMPPHPVMYPAEPGMESSSDSSGV
jgi:hypothetical protein